MSSGERKKVSREDIQLVQNLIERCLQLYMSKTEVVNTLLGQAKIEPGFTELVWQKLEEENQEFFKAYYLRLMVKDQIMQFNGLLERQVELMRQIYPLGMDSIPMTNGSHLAPLHQNSACYEPDHTGPALKAENIHQSLGSCLPNTYRNGRPSLQSSLQSGTDMAAHTRRMDLPQNLLAQNSNLGMLQGMNGGMIKSESVCMGNTFMFGNDSSVLEPRSAIGDAAVSPFSSVESNPNPLSDALLDAVGGSVGLLGQIPRNFSLSDLTADFPNTSGILESYSRSAYVADTELDRHGRDEHQGPNRLC